MKKNFLNKRVLTAIITIMVLMATTAILPVSASWNAMRDEGCTSSRAYYWGLILNYKNPAESFTTSLEHIAEAKQLSAGEQDNLDINRDGRLSMLDVTLWLRIRNISTFKDTNGKTRNYTLKDPMEVTQANIESMKEAFIRPNNVITQRYDFDKSGGINQTDIKLAEEFLRISSWHSMCPDDLTIENMDSLVQCALDEGYNEFMVRKVSNIEELGQEAIIIYEGDAYIFRQDLGYGYYICLRTGYNWFTVYKYISEFSGYCLIKEN